MNNPDARTSPRALTVGELIAELRKFMPSTLVIVDGIRDFNGVFDVRSAVAWELDDPLVDRYTTDLMKGLESHKRGEGRPAVYLNSGADRVSQA